VFRDSVVLINSRIICLSLSRVFIVSDGKVKFNLYQFRIL